MVQVAIDRIVPVNEASSRLREIVEGAVGDQFWVIAENGQPRAAVVDVQFLNQLIRRAWFDELSGKTQRAFRDYLQSKGLDPDQMTEAEIEAILQS